MSGVDLYNQYKGEESVIQEINDAINRNKEEINKISIYESSVLSFFNGPLIGMKNQVQTIHQEVKNKSRLSLEMKRWEVRRFLRDMKYSLEQATKGFSVEPEFRHIIQKLAETMKTMINIYERVQNFQDQVKLANYIANIESKPASVSQVGNQEYKLEISEIEKTIEQCTILEQYSKIFMSFKQWAFPFASKFLNVKGLLKVSNNRNSFDEVTDLACQNLESMRARVEEYSTSVMKMDESIMKANFAPGQAVGPFFVWSAKNSRQEIIELLQGKPTIFVSEVSDPCVRACVKFNRIGLEIKCDIKEHDAKLEDILQGYYFELTHLGNSCYKFRNQVYQFPSSPITMICNFKQESKNSSMTNMAFAKIAEASCTLSPYACWVISLKPIGFRVPKDSLEKALRTVIGHVKVVLVGEGIFVDEQKIEKNLDMDVYKENKIEKF